MYLTPDTGGSEPGRKPAVEYAAQVASPIASGEARLTIGENALTIAALFVTVDVTFAEMNDIRLTNYVVTVKADSGNYSFSRMGSWCQPFYDALYGAYNKAVLRSMFIEGDPIVTARGYCRFSETCAETAMATAPASMQSMGNMAVPVHVYENNVTALPPDLTARRVPLCFVCGIEQGSFELVLKLDTGESYSYAKLGFETAPFLEAVEKQIRKLREKTLAAVRGIDATLTAMQASQLAGLIPRGVAAPIGRLADISPSFVAALENKIAATRAADSYAAFKELCGPARIWVGFREADNAEADAPGSVGAGTIGAEAAAPGSVGAGHPAPGSVAEGDGAGAIGAADGGGGSPGPYMIWLIAPSPNGEFAAVEFAVADSATFVYRTGGNFEGFARQLNRALEAINFRREVIRLADWELLRPENADYYMAAKRTAALRFVRSSFAGRVIHSGAGSWRRKLTELWA